MASCSHKQLFSPSGKRQVYRFLQTLSKHPGSFFQDTFFPLPASGNTRHRQPIPALSAAGSTHRIARPHSHRRSVANCFYAPPFQKCSRRGGKFCGPSPAPKDRTESALRPTWISHLPGHIPPRFDHRFAGRDIYGPAVRSPERQVGNHVFINRNAPNNSPSGEIT